MTYMESGKKKVRDELKIIVEIMFENAINRNGRVYKNLDKVVEEFNMSKKYSGGGTNGVKGK